MKNKKFFKKIMTGTALTGTGLSLMQVQVSNVVSADGFEIPDLVSRCLCEEIYKAIRNGTIFTPEFFNRLLRMIWYFKNFFGIEKERDKKWGITTFKDFKRDRVDRDFHGAASSFSYHLNVKKLEFEFLLEDPNVSKEDKEELKKILEETERVQEGLKVLIHDKKESLRGISERIERTQKKLDILLNNRKETYKNDKDLKEICEDFVGMFGIKHDVELWLSEDKKNLQDITKEIEEVGKRLKNLLDGDSESLEDVLEVTKKVQEKMNFIVDNTKGVYDRKLYNKILDQVVNKAAFFADWDAILIDVFCEEYIFNKNKKACKEFFDNYKDKNNKYCKMGDDLYKKAIEYLKENKEKSWGKSSTLSKYLEFKNSLKDNHGSTVNNEFGGCFFEIDDNEDNGVDVD